MSKDGIAPVAGVPDPALLVVDDNEDNRYTLSLQLNAQGYYNIAIATNGLEALSVLHSKPFDLVLLEPIREVWIHDEAFAASRLSMMRIMARRMNAATVIA